MLEPQPKQKMNKDMSDLGLSSTFVPDIPKDILFPEELNTYLRDQIHCLTHENGMLKRNLSECEGQLKESLTKVDNLSKEVKKYEDATSGSNFSTVSNIASAKIVDLSKKLREKSSELEVTKTKCSKLESQLKKIEIPTIQETLIEKEKKSHEKIIEKEKIDDIKQLQEKLTTTTAKLFEAKNINTQLKNDLKLANKFLQSEIGETFENLQSLVNSGVNWRGRSQMVCDLQQKNAELREKIKTLSEKSPKSSEQPHMKSDKRLEIVSKENCTLKNELQELKRKLEASKARLKVFETENSVLKGKISVINEQQDNDRNLITSLTAQLSTIRNLQNDDFKKKDQNIIRLQKEIKELKSIIEKEKLRGDNLINELNEKNDHINYLNNQKNNPNQGNNFTKSETNLSNRPKSSKIDDKILGRLEAERIRLLELTKIANERLENERKTLNNLQLQLKGERQKNARLESRIARLELDKHDKNSVYSGSGNRGKEKEENFKDKLELAEENVKVLQNRLDIEQKERQIDFNEFSKILQNYSKSN